MKECLPKCDKDPVTGYDRNFIDKLFCQLACYVAEQLIMEKVETKIIRIEQRWRDRGQITPKNLNWLQTTLEKAERRERRRGNEQALKFD